MTPAVAVERATDEVEVEVRESAAERGVRPRFAAHDDEPAGDVVDAVAVLGSRLGQQRMFEDATPVGEPVQMIEGEDRRDGALTPPRSR